jgi:hypothetical protein
MYAMATLGFTCEEMDTISALASALPRSVRGAFLQLIASRLGGYPPELRGPGLVYRIAAEAQRDFLKAGPVAIGGGGKYGRAQPLLQGRRR